MPSPGSSAASAAQVDRRWMEEALRAAAAAGARGEIPIGAAVVLGERLLASAGNASIGSDDPTGHAEILALRAAARAVGSYRLTGAVLYVTVEPCLMCMGAALHARIGRLVYGCADPKGGAAGSVFDVSADPRLNHRIGLTRGVAEDASRALLQDFFRVRRVR